MSKKPWTFLILLFCLSPLWAEDDSPQDQAPPPPATPNLASPSSQPSEESDEINVTSDKFFGNWQNRLSFQGKVRVTYRDTLIMADRMDVDLDAKVAYLSGSVLVREKTGETTTEAIELDLDSRRWSFTNARLTFFPNPQIGTVAPFFAETAKGDVSPERTSFFRGTLTSCDLSEPHYEIRAEEVVITPQDNIVMRHVSFWLLGRKIFERKNYVIPLRPSIERRRGLRLPFLGHNEVEGFFIKNSFNYLATEHLLGTLFLDFMTKRGIGYGAQHSYGFADALGAIYFYTVNDRSTGARQFDVRFRHQQRLARDVIATLGVDSTKNNQFTAPGSSFRNIDFSLQSPSRNMFLHLRSEKSASPFFGGTDSLAGQFSIQRAQISRNTFLDFSADYRRSLIVLGEPRSEELTNRLQLTHTGRLLETILRFEKLQDLDNNTSPGDEFRNALDRVPEIALFWSSNRNQRKLLGLLPADAQFSVGDYREYGNPNQTGGGGLRLRRTYFQLDFPGVGDEYVKRWGENTELTFGGTFKQSLYSNDTAQYVLEYRSHFQHGFGERAGVFLDYWRQKPVGFTPFLFDVVVPFHSLDLGLFYQTGQLTLEVPRPPTPFLSREQPAETRQPEVLHFFTPKFRFNLSAGKDLENGAYRDLVWRAQFIPTRSFYASVSAAHDLNAGEFRDVILRLRAGAQALAPFLSYPGHGEYYPFSQFPHFPISPYDSFSPYGGYPSPYGTPFGLPSPYAPRYGTGAVPLSSERSKPRSVFKRIGFNVAARFNPTTGKLGRVNTYLNWQLSDQWAIEWLAGYNGLTKEMDFSQFRITRDLHDFQVYLTADKFRREVRLDVTLKAFPLFDTRFGTGGQGQLLSPSVGDIF